MSWSPSPATGSHAAQDDGSLRPLRLAAAVLVFTLALGTAEAARAEVVARGVQDGMLALGPNGTPFVSYVRGTSAVVASRVSPGRWRAARVAPVPAGARVMAFAVGSKGPAALVQSGDDRTLVLVRRRGGGWQRTRLAGGLPAAVFLGWPGLALDGAGLPAVAYARWNVLTQATQLVLARIDARGRLHSRNVTTEGFPQSLVAPPATPVFVGGRIRVLETYGYRLVGTIEWYPERRTWTGLFLDNVLADFPLGPVLARSRNGTLYAAWSMSMVGIGALPLSLAVHGRSTAVDFVANRAVTTALALPASGPEIAANELVRGDQLEFVREDHVWSGTVVRGKTLVQLDGWMAGYAASPPNRRDVLLARPAGLSWFRGRGPLTTRVSLEASVREDGRIRLSGSVRDVRAGRVTVYREQPGGARRTLGQAVLTGGSFSLVDSAPVRPYIYRAVYTDPKSAIPYAAVAAERVPEDDDTEAAPGG